MGFPFLPLRRHLHRNITRLDYRLQPRLMDRATPAMVHGVEPRAGTTGAGDGEVETVVVEEDILAILIAIMRLPTIPTRLQTMVDIPQLLRFLRRRL